MEYFAGYPIDITTLNNGDILYFNGEKWIGIVKGTQPTFHALAVPSVTTRQSVVFDNIPVIIDALFPNQILYLKKHVIRDTIVVPDDLRYNEASRGSTREKGELIFWAWTNGDYPNPENRIGLSQTMFTFEVGNSHSITAPSPTEASFSTLVELI